MLLISAEFVLALSGRHSTLPSLMPRRTRSSIDYMHVVEWPTRCLVCTETYLFGEEKNTFDLIGLDGEDV